MWFVGPRDREALFIGGITLSTFPSWLRLPSSFFPFRLLDQGKWALSDSTRGNGKGDRSFPFSLQINDQRLHSVVQFPF